MINARETQIILERFFNDCYKFWLRKCNERKAFELAIKDTKTLHSDPYVLCGDEIDAETKAIFIKYREMDLGL